MHPIAARHRRFAAVALTLTLGGLVFGAAWGAEAYRWTDPNGVVHFGDHPPPGSAAGDVQPISFAPIGSQPYDPREEYFSVVNQARRMTEQRIQAEKAWRERLEAQARLERERRVTEAQQSEPPAAPEPYLFTHPAVWPWRWPFPYTDFSQHPRGHPAYSPYWMPRSWGPSRHAPAARGQGAKGPRSSLKPAS